MHVVTSCEETNTRVNDLSNNKLYRIPTMACTEYKDESTKNKDKHTEYKDKRTEYKDICINMHRM